VFCTLQLEVCCRIVSATFPKCTSPKGWLASANGLFFVLPRLIVCETLALCSCWASRSICSTECGHRFKVVVTFASANGQMKCQRKVALLIGILQLRLRLKQCDLLPAKRCLAIHLRLKRLRCFQPKRKPFKNKSKRCRLFRLNTVFLVEMCAVDRYWRFVRIDRSAALRDKSLQTRHPMRSRGTLSYLGGRHGRLMLAVRVPAHRS
jgi:hypothetical protein